MTSDVTNLLEGLNRKELLEITNLKKISIPNNWSRELIVELLSLNITLDDIQTNKTKPIKSKKISEGGPIIVIKILLRPLRMLLQLKI